ncbi:hypothetical protein AB0J20_19665 [Micromonospora costi]|uniref:hypothetical protein n=1 Tax=Micromonospora costi TaxID=1530042 RepID=UPI0033FCAAA4
MGSEVSPGVGGSVSPAVGVGVGSVSGTEIVPDGDGVAVGPPVGDPVGVGDAVGVGVGLGVGDTLGVGDAVGGCGVVRVGCGTGAAGRWVGREPVGLWASGASGRRAVSGRAGRGSGKSDDHSFTADGLPEGRAGGRAGWLVVGMGTTTGPTEGVGMNGTPLSGRAVLPTVAEPALIAARIGMDAVPASSATVNR